MNASYANEMIEKIILNSSRFVSKYLKPNLSKTDLGDPNEENNLDMSTRFFFYLAKINSFKIV